MNNGNSTGNVPEPIDRPTGIFTERQRKWLLGQLDGELSPNNERATSYRVRRRLRHALIDFSLLQWMESEDINQIFQGVHDDVDEGHLGHDASDSLTQSLPYVFAFLMRGFRLRHELIEWAWEAGIHTAIYQGAIRTQDELPIMDLSYTFDIKGVVPLDKLESRYESGEVLTRDALLALVISDRIELDDAQSYSAVTDNEDVLRSITTDIEDKVEDSGWSV